MARAAPARRAGEDAVAPPRTREERLFSAAVLRRSILTGPPDAGGALESVYAGVLTDLGLEPAEVEAYLAENAAAVDAALRRGRTP
jgi:hypothetical protein